MDARNQDGFPIKNRLLLIQGDDNQEYAKIYRDELDTFTSAIGHWRSHETFLLTLFDAQLMLEVARRKFPEKTCMIVYAADCEAIEAKTWALRHAAKGQQN